MTQDPLDRLSRALKQGTPPPSEAAKQAALRAAAENFSRAHQGSPAQARPTPDRTQEARGFWTGVKTMLTRLTSTRALMGTSALATAAIAVVLLGDFGPLRHGSSHMESALRDAIRRAEQRTADDERGRSDTLAGQVEGQQRSAPPAPIVLGKSDMVQLEEIAPAEEAESFADGDMAVAPRSAPLLQFTPGDGIQMERIAPEPARPLVVRPPESSSEAFPEAAANPLKLTAEEPVSTFSIDVDTAAYALVRNSLQNGTMPPRAAVRIEEMVNYFDYAYPAPDSREVPFATSVSIAETPWNPYTKLMHIGIQGYELAERPPLNLVFLIDTSGSMEDPRKLPLLKQSFKLLLETLSAEDSVAIVTYAGSAGMALAPTPASESAIILDSLDQLAAGGSTAGQAGLQQAYSVAEQMATEGEIARVILATDGDFNVGISDPEELKTFVEDKRDSGTYLSVLGFGRGNYNGAVMQSLAQNGNGIAAYIDTLAEAQKVLVEDMTANLFPIAGDVKIQVEFNPAQISEYRLIGYETRALNREDFNNDAVDAGEIGAGHQVTALYEITPVGSPAERISDLRYGTSETTQASDTSGEYAFLKLRYKLPGEERSKLIETPVLPDRADIAPQETRFAAAVAGFAGLLRGHRATPGWDYADALALAAANRGEDAYGYRSELLSLIRMADALD
ncbi:vWA domain-containing protein [Oceanibium sediminis]|uniref:vWA domain-containing protein n=1 Tax=Oceanibium sediminis TaxID=2026339 RepID=UPI000DD2E49A|nr:VWA domain-containing protein [Oceanibium sediminis]